MTGKQKKGKGRADMLTATIVLGVIAAALLFIAWRNGEGQHITGLQAALKMTVQLLPLLIFAFIIAGLVPVMLPHEALSKWIGAESGIRGILIGTVAGGLAPGGPYVSLPIAAGLLKSGASVGTMVAFVTGWSLLAFARLPMEVAIMGWRFTAVRFACTFFFPPIAGLIAQAIFSGKNV